MNFKLPRRHRKNFEIISNKKIDENFNENESKKSLNKLKMNMRKLLTHLVQTREEKNHI